MTSGFFPGEIWWIAFWRTWSRSQQFFVALIRASQATESVGKMAWQTLQTITWWPFMTFLGHFGHNSSTKIQDPSFSFTSQDSAHLSKHQEPARNRKNSLGFPFYTTFHITQVYHLKIHRKFETPRILWFISNNWTQHFDPTFWPRFYLHSSTGSNWPWSWVNWIHNMLGDMGSINQLTMLLPNILWTQFTIFHG